jgi:RNA polymerase sigma-70 factor, ECF subfamily
VNGRRSSEQASSASMSQPSADPDRTLVDRTLAGETAAFGRLVERHGDVVYRVAARVVGPDDADDVSQDALLRAFHRLDRFRGEGPFRAWLLQITHNTALNTLARRLPEPAGGPEEVARTDPSPLSERQPASRLEDDERRDRLALKLRQLRPEHRAVLVLRDLEGFPYGEIADATKTPIGTVKGRLHRARTELIDMLRHNAYDWELPNE